MATWSMKEARNRFSEMLKEANANGPQVITCRGVELAVALSPERYRFLKDQRLKALLLGGPKFDDFEIKRDRSMGRKVRL